MDRCNTWGKACDKGRRPSPARDRIALVGLCTIGRQSAGPCPMFVSMAKDRQSRELMDQVLVAAYD